MLFSVVYADLLPGLGLAALLGALGGRMDLAEAVLPWLEEKGKAADNASAIFIHYSDVHFERSEQHDPGTL